MFVNDCGNSHQPFSTSEYGYKEEHAWSEKV